MAKAAPLCRRMRHRDFLHPHMKAHISTRIDNKPKLRTKKWFLTSELCKTAQKRGAIFFAPDVE